MTVDNSTGAATGASLAIRSSKPVYPENAATKEYAASLDASDPLKDFRNKFIIPSKANINSKKLAKPGMQSPSLLILPLTNIPRSLARTMYLLLWKLAWSPTKSDGKIHGSPSGYLVIDRSLWSFH